MSWSRNNRRVRKLSYEPITPPLLPLLPTPAPSTSYSQKQQTCQDENIRRNRIATVGDLPAEWSAERTVMVGVFSDSEDDSDDENERAYQEEYQKEKESQKQEFLTKKKGSRRAPNLKKPEG
jgi:hypothetical protein